MTNPETHTITGYDIQKKKAGKHSKTASVIWLPAGWAGKKVVAILLEE